MENVTCNEFPKIETKRLVLRELNENDIDDLFETFSQEKVMKYYGMHPFTSRFQAEELIEKFATSYKEDRGIRWAVVLKQNNTLIGTCGFHNISTVHKRAEVGYEMNPKYWGMGYIAETLCSVLDYGFAKMEFNRIEGLIYPENEASGKVLIKQGFRREGLLHDYAFFMGEGQDLIMHSLLKKDFLEEK